MKRIATTWKEKMHGAHYMQINYNNFYTTMYVLKIITIKTKVVAITMGAVVDPYINNT